MGGFALPGYARQAKSAAQGITSRCKSPQCVAASQYEDSLTWEGGFAGLIGFAAARQ
jgi:hypothetical protein